MPVCLSHAGYREYVEQLAGIFVCEWLLVEVLKC